MTEPCASIAGDKCYESDVKYHIEFTANNSFLGFFATLVKTTLPVFREIQIYAYNTFLFQNIAFIFHPLKSYIV